MKSEDATSRQRPAVPTPEGGCATCGATLDEPFGWCSNCRAAYCFRCGRAHFCTPGCPAAGCHAGLCVREVSNGVLSERWGLPPP